MSPLMVSPPGQDHKPNSTLYEGKENQERLGERDTTLRRAPRWPTSPPLLPDWKLIVENGLLSRRVAIWLPPYSPELNPVEHIWEEIREKWFPNRIFNSLEEVVDQLEKALKWLMDSPDYVRSMTCFAWMLN
jgi:transposase